MCAFVITSFLRHLIIISQQKFECQDNCFSKFSIQTGSVWLLNLVTVPVSLASLLLPHLTACFYFYLLFILFFFFSSLVSQLSHLGSREIPKLLFSDRRKILHSTVHLTLNFHHTLHFDDSQLSKWPISLEIPLLTILGMVVGF